MFQRYIAGFGKGYGIRLTGQVQDAVTGFIKLLWVFILFEQGLHIRIQCLGMIIAALHVICGTSLFVIPMVGTQVFLSGGIPAFAAVPGMCGYQIGPVVDLYQGSGVDHLDLHSDIGEGHAVIMFIHAQINMIVLGHLVLPIVLDLKGLHW